MAAITKKLTLSKNYAIVYKSSLKELSFYFYARRTPLNCTAVAKKPRHVLGFFDILRPAMNPARSSCEECGYVDPVSHIGLFISETLEVLFTSKKKLKKRQQNAIARLSTKIFDICLFHIPLAIGLLRATKNPKRFITERSEVIWKEAHQRNIPIEQITLFNKPTEWYRAKPLHTHWEYFLSLPIPGDLLSQNYEWMDDKLLFKQELAKTGVPTPQIASVTTLTHAENAFNSFSKPVIVKPRRGSRGRHTTTHIMTKDRLSKAFTSAQKLCYFVVIEQHLFGSVCRATVVDGVVVGFFQMDPPRVTGDGVHTVFELIQIKNSKKPSGVEDVMWNTDTAKFIESWGYTKDSILATGEVLDLLKQTGRFVGGYTKELLEEVHPKLLNHISNAAKVVDAPVIGFDLIIKDPTKDPDTQTWGFIEANSLPYIDRHHNAREGKQQNVAGKVWDLWNKPARDTALKK